MDEKRRERKSHRPTHDSIVWSRWYQRAPPEMRNRMCTVSALRTVSIPMTSIVALPTLKIPYFALNVSRSPTGNGTAGATGTTAWVDVAVAATTAELELEDPTVLPVHTVSCALSDPPPANNTTMSIAVTLPA